jgi:hypothetical protein
MELQSERERNAICAEPGRGKQPGVEFFSLPTPLPPPRKRKTYRGKGVERGGKKNRGVSWITSRGHIVVVGRGEGGRETKLGEEY